MVDLLSSPFSHRLFLTLVHFFWQGFLIGLVYCLVMANINAKRVELRYATSLLVLIGMALCPIITFAVLQRSPSPTLAITATRDEPVKAVAWQPANIGSPIAERDWVRVQPSGEQAWRITLSDAAGRGLAMSQPYVLLVWLAGVLVSAARLSAGLLGLFWLRADRREIRGPLQGYSQAMARRLGVASGRVFASSRVRVAGVAGLWKPVVLLPTAWLSELPPDILEAVIAHELAHIRRFDTWVNLLQRVLETLLFYHPMVWWLSNRVRYQRELCCDKLAVQATGDRGLYIRALEQVGRLQVYGSLSLSPAFTGDRKMNLLSRVQHILCTPRHDREPSWVVGVAAIVSVLSVALATGVVSDSAVAFAQEREGGRSAEAEAGERRSPEAERGERRSPEAERGERRSPEAERGERRSPEAERGDRPSPEAEARGDARDPLRRFQPQSDREAALYRMIVQLQREVAELRRAVGQANFNRDGDQRFRERDEQARYREGDRRPDEQQRDRPRSGDYGATDRPQVAAAHQKLQKIFVSRDKNRDQRLSRDEFNSLFEGGPRNDVFDAADQNGDQGLTFDEFVDHRLGGQPSREGDPRSDRPQERERDR